MYSSYLVFSTCIQAILVWVCLRSPEKLGYESVGVIEKPPPESFISLDADRHGATTLEITELPIKKWTEDGLKGSRESASRTTKYRCCRRDTLSCDLC